MQTQHNDDVQRNEQWFAERSGIPTASRFNDIMTEPRTKADKEAGKLSDTAFSYAVELLKERLTGDRASFSTSATEWGTEHEPMAIDAYYQATNESVMECGFVRHSELATGASPDGLIGLDGGIEIKCPYNSANHIKTYLSGEVPKQYVAQVQGQMWVLNLEWVDFVSFDPRMPAHSQLKIIRVERDQDYIDRLEEKVVNFIAKLDEFEQQLRGQND